MMDYPFHKDDPFTMKKMTPSSSRNMLSSCFMKSPWLHCLLPPLPSSSITIVSNNVICNIIRQYMDTRTQANLSKLKADHNKQEQDVHTEEMYVIIERRRRSDLLERMMKAHKSTSPIWDSKTLEVIAAKWTPITIIFVVAFVLLWSSLKA
ncbi:hypothetical protein R6Q57_005306 [Mikania cordata]